MEDASNITMEQVNQLPSNSELLKFIIRSLITTRDLLRCELEDSKQFMLEDAMPLDTEDVEVVEDNPISVLEATQTSAARKARIAELMKQNKPEASSNLPCSLGAMLTPPDEVFGEVIKREAASE